MTQSTQELADLGETELIEYLEGNTLINSDLLDPPPPSGFTSKSK